jgi:hypothetical protein
MKRLALAALLFVACSHAPPPVSLAPPAKPPAAKEYLEQLRKFTRHCHIISDFDEALTADSTLHAPEFRAAFGEKFIQLYKLSEDDAAKKRAQLMSEIADVWELHMETSAHFYTINDFTLGKGIWRVTLVDDQGRAVAPVELRQSLDKREVDMAWYPYATIFSRGWRVRFPRTMPDGTPFITPETKTIALRIAGPPGSCDMIWQLKP